MVLQVLHLSNEHYIVTFYQLFDIVKRKYALRDSKNATTRKHKPFFNLKIYDVFFPSYCFFKFQINFKEICHYPTNTVHQVAVYLLQFHTD